MWTPMSTVPKKADKLNLSLSLSLSLTAGHIMNNDGKFICSHINVLVQDCIIFIANALMLQSYTEPPIYLYHFQWSPW